MSRRQCCTSGLASPSGSCSLAASRSSRNALHSCRLHSVKAAGRSSVAVAGAVARSPSSGGERQAGSARSPAVCRRSPQAEVWVHVGRSPRPPAHACLASSRRRPPDLVSPQRREPRLRLRVAKPNPTHRAASCPATQAPSRSCGSFPPRWKPAGPALLRTAHRASPSRSHSTAIRGAPNPSPDPRRH